MNTPTERHAEDALSNVSVALERFEQAWAEREFPRLGDFVSPQMTSANRLEHFIAIMKVDLEYRWRTDFTIWSVCSVHAGKALTGNLQADLPYRPFVEDYVERYQEFRQCSALQFLDLLVAEYETRTKWGDRPSHSQYARRLDMPPEPILDALQRADRRLEMERSTNHAAGGNRNRFGDYVAVREIGRGGMGIVYEARHHETNQRVALKTIRRADGPLLSHLKHEFRSLAGISHPNLVRFDELFADGERPFITMEYVEGVQFTDFCRKYYDSSAEPETMVDFERLVGATIQLVEAIRFLHDSRRLHRDIKPSNVLVTSDDRVVVLDFGLAVETYSDVFRNSEHLPVGTFPYMSPEQQQGGSLSPASDWYSVGVMLYESMTSRLPFEADTFAGLLANKKSNRPLSAKSIVPALSDEFDELCMSLLNPLAELRPTGDEILRRLGGDGRRATDVVPSSVWVGRSDTLDALARHFDQMLKKEPVTVFLKGQSGIGKTTLIDRFLRQVRKSPRLVILRGKCYENEFVPFKGMDSLVDSLAAYLSRQPDERVERVMPVDVAALCRMFPVLAQVPVLGRGSRELSAVMTQDARHGGFRALRQLLCRLAAFQELVLFIDDLQWGGRDTAELFAEVFRGPDAPACLTICAFREEDTESEFSACLAQRLLVPGHHLSCREIKLDLLSDAESVALATRMLGNATDAATIEAVAEESKGHPLFARMLACQSRRIQLPPAAAGPVRLDTAIIRIVQEASPAQRRLLELVSVVGCALEDHLFEKAAGLADCRSLLRGLRDRRLLRSIGTAATWRVDVYHDTIRQTVLRSLTRQQLASHSLRLAGALEDTSVDAATLGRLYAQAGHMDRAGEHFLRAARAAHQSLAFHRAIELYRRSLECWGPGCGRDAEIRCGLAEALGQIGYGSESATEYIRAAEASKTADRLALHSQAARRLLTCGHVEKGMRILKAVLASAQIRCPRNSATTIASLLWNDVALRMRGIEFRITTEDGLELSDRNQLDAYWTAVAGLSAVDPIKAAGFAARNLRLALRVGEPTYLIRAMTAYCGHLATGGWKQCRQTGKILAQIEKLASRDGGPYARATHAIARGVTAHLQCRYVGAIEALDAAVALLVDEQSQTSDRRCRDVTWELSLSRTFCMWSLMYTGQFAELARRQPNLLRGAEERGDLFATLNYGTVVMTSRLLSQDDPDEARRRLAVDGDRLSNLGFFVQHHNHCLAVAFLEQYQGSGVLAWRHLEKCWPRYVRSLLAQVQQVRVDFWQARGRAALAAAAESGNPERFKGDARRAARRLGREKTPWADAMSLMIGAGLSALGRQRGAADDLREAARCLSDVDAHLFAAAARIRAAQLSGGRDDEAIEVMRFLGVRNPARMTAAIIPGINANE